MNQGIVDSADPGRTADNDAIRGIDSFLLGGSLPALADPLHRPVKLVRHRSRNPLAVDLRELPVVPDHVFGRRRKAVPYVLSHCLLVEQDGSCVVKFVSQRDEERISVDFSQPRYSRVNFRYVIVIHYC